MLVDTNTEKPSVSELLAALQELLAAEQALFPAERFGIAAQKEWAARQTRARQAAADLIFRATGVQA